jgi:predicted ester cyclase
VSAVVTETNIRTVVTDFIDRVWDAGDPDALTEITTDGFALHQLVAGETHDRESFGAFLTDTHDAMPDFSMDLEDLVVEGDDAVALLTMAGTPEKPLQAVQPTGKSFSVKVFQKYRVEDGRMAEVWVMADAIGTLSQLGVFPPGPRLMLRIAAGKLKAKLFGG